MASPKAASRTLYLDTLSAQREVEVLTKKVERLDKSIVDGQAAGKKMTKEIADLDKAKASLQNVQNQIDRGLKPSLKQLEDIARKTNFELKRLSQSDPEFQKKLQLYQDATSRIRTLKAEISGVNVQQKNWLSTVNQFSGGLIGGIAAGIGIQSITNLIADSNAEFDEAELSAARFEAKLRNLGRLDVLPRLTAEADKLAQQFAFLDNDDITNVFSKLIDYGKLTETQIKQLTPVIIDFAANQRISLEESTSVLIKALEGNGRALKEYGIDIKDAKTESERFGIVMDEVGAKVKGAAETFSNSSAGAKANTKQDIAEIKEAIGGQLQPAVLEFYKFIRGVLDGAVSFFSDITGNLKNFVGEAVAAGVRLFGIETKRNKGEGNFTVNQTQVDQEVENFIKADEDKQKRIMKALATQYRENIAAYQKAVRENDQAAIKTYALLVNTDAAVLRAIAKNKKPDNTVIGTGDGLRNKPDKPTKEKKEENPRFKLLRELKQLEDELLLLGKTNDEKELQRIVNKYNKLINEAKAYSDIVIRLEAARSKEVSALFEQITKKQEEEQKKQAELEKKKTLTIQQENLKRREAEFSNVKDEGKRNLLANASLDILNAETPEQRLEAEKEYLRLKKEITLGDEKLTAAEKKLIEAQYLAEVAEMNEAYRQAEYEKNIASITQAFEVAQQFVGVLDQIDQIISNKENAELQKEVKRNDVKRSAYKRLLDQRVISEAQYRQKIAALDELEDKRRAQLAIKQFNRQKALQIAQAVINGALAVTNILATVPKADFGIMTAILIAAAVASTAAQIGVIASTKPPELAKGGIAKGGRHSEGGIDLYDRKSKRVVANIEGGEPLLVLSRNTYANNKDVVDELLDASMNRGGERINPGRIRRFWESRPYRSLNYNGASRALNKRYFETGGVVQTGPAATEAAAAGNDNTELMNNVMSVLLMVAETNNSLKEELAKGIVATMSLKQLRDTEKLDEQIRADGTMRP